MLPDEAGAQVTMTDSGAEEKTLSSFYFFLGSKSSSTASKQS